MSFTSACPTDRLLLDAVRDVAETAQPTDPASCPQRAFNASRTDAGHPQLPRADWIATRLGGPWAQLLDVIFAPDRSEQHWVALRARDTGPRGLTEAAAAEALRWAADALDQRTVRPAESERVSAPARAVGARSHRHGSAAAFLLPTAAQIEHAVGWDTALEAAGLDPRTATGGRPGMRAADALDVFLSENGYLTSRHALDKWAAANGLRLTGQAQVDAIAELRANRDALGLWTPPAVLPASQRGDYGPVAATPARGPRRRAGRWTIDTVRTGLLAAVAESRAAAIDG